MLLPSPAMADNANTSAISSHQLASRGSEDNGQINTQRVKITTDGKEFNVTYIVIPKSAELKCDVIIGQNGIGHSESLSALAEQSEALIAINGGFFQCFDSNKPMDPYGTIIKNGRLIHKGEIGSTIGFTDSGSAKIAIVEPVITATINGKTLEMDLFNHTPSADGNTVALFNKHRGETIDFSYGRNILISGGEVTQIVSGRNVQIPTNGYVLNLTGSAIEQYEELFKKGSKISFKASYRDQNGNKLNWSNIQTAVGAGPILVLNGAISIDLAKENFSDEKSTQLTINRSAVGVTSYGDIILISGVSCTISQLADIMLQLGAANAISMDGGASSGLYVKNQYVIKPSRNISNALVFKLH